jgi:fluoroacetyl-CoA thioesterase
MNFESLIGIIGYAEDQVSDIVTSVSQGIGALPLYSTSSMIILMEKAACSSLQNHLPLGSTTIGTIINIKHLSATPVGHHVQAEAKVVQVEGKKIIFEVRAFDEKGKIGEGTHERFIVDVETFMTKVRKKDPVK